MVCLCLHTLLCLHQNLQLDLFLHYIGHIGVPDDAVGIAKLDVGVGQILNGVLQAVVVRADGTPGGGDGQVGPVDPPQPIGGILILCGQIYRLRRTQAQVVQVDIGQVDGNILRLWIGTYIDTPQRY